jgi:hypothetical protein
MFPDYCRQPAFVARTGEVCGDPPRRSDSFRLADHPPGMTAIWIPNGRLRHTLPRTGSSSGVPYNALAYIGNYNIIILPTLISPRAEELTFTYYASRRE